MRKTFPKTLPSRILSLRFQGSLTSGHSPCCEKSAYLTTMLLYHVRGAHFVSTARFVACCWPRMYTYLRSNLCRIHKASHDQIFFRAPLVSGFRLDSPRSTKTPPPPKCPSSPHVRSAESPDPATIPSTDLVGVTVTLITCCYKQREFIRVGYYVNNEHNDPAINAEIQVRACPSSTVLSSVSACFSSCGLNLLL